MIAPVERTRGWAETLRALEAAIVGGDAAVVSSIDLPAELGPVPPELAERATVVLAAITGLQREVDEQLDAVSAELNRRPSRQRRITPPAPSQLDCSA